MTIGTSIVLIGIGAVLKWAVTAHVSGINLQTAGTVLFVLGIVGLVLSAVYSFYSSSRARPPVVADERDTRYDAR